MRASPPPAPTRSSPAGRRANVFSAVPLSVLDRLGDLPDAGVRRGPECVAPALRTAGRVLTRAAHRVEHLPLLRIGEDSSARSGGPHTAYAARGAT